MMSSTEERNRMETVTPSQPVSPHEYVIIYIPTRVPRDSLPPNTSLSPAPAVGAGSPGQTTPGGALVQTTPDGPPDPTTPGGPPDPTTLGGPPDQTTPGSPPDPTTPNGAPGQTTPNGALGQTTPNGASVQTTTPDEEITPTCEIWINKLVDMQVDKGKQDPEARKKLLAKAALREWTEDQRELQGKVERRTKQTDKLIFEIYQLVGLYSVFVGVVFTAAVQSQQLQCQHIWSPVLLCIVAWLVIILVTRKRWRRYKRLRVTIKSEETSRKALYLQISQLKSHGHNDFCFKTHAKEKLDTASSGQKQTRTRASTSWVITTVLTALTFILVGSFIHIMCHEEIAAQL